MKVKTLFLIVFAILMSKPLFSQEEGRIIYTDFEPDTIITPVKYHDEGGDPIDVNKDAQWDLYFSKWYSSEGCCFLDMYSYTDWKFCLVEYDSIPNHTSWHSDMDITPSSLHSNTIINIGLRHWIEDVGFCYGWMRFSYNFFSVCEYAVTIYDMAYCTIPNYPLVFGQTDFVDIDENEYATSDVRLFPNPAEDRLCLQLSGNVSCKNVEIYGIDGRLLKSQDEDFKNINIIGLPAGLYIAKITLNDGTVFTEKVVVR